MCFVSPIDKAEGPGAAAPACTTAEQAWLGGASRISSEKKSLLLLGVVFNAYFDTKNSHRAEMPPVVTFSFLI